MLTLFDRLGNIEAPNRRMIAPAMRARSTREHVATTTMIVEYYVQRASAGVILSEDPVISPQEQGWRFATGIWNDVWLPTLLGLLPKLRANRGRSHLDDGLARYRRACEGLGLGAGMTDCKLVHPYVGSADQRMCDRGRGPEADEINTYRTRLMKDRHGDPS